MKLITLILFSTSLLAQAMPVQKLTPGAVRTSDRHSICTTRTGSIRNVSASLKRKVFAEYGIQCVKCGQLYEVDHLISLEIGGNNDIANLWPQPYKVPGAHQKDVLENKLHAMICDGAIEPKAAQRAIADNWFTAYQKYVRPSDRKLGR